jgi:hypothetical protein
MIFAAFPALACLARSGPTRFSLSVSRDRSSLRKETPRKTWLRCGGDVAFLPRRTEEMLMNEKRQKKEGSTQASKLRHEHEAEAGVAGALAGAALGAIAGPPGALAGAVLGGVFAAGAAAALEKNSADESARDAELDAEIGVTGGDLGAPNLEHPPAQTGAYSSASAGATSSTGGAAAEGPIQDVDS